VHRALGLRPRPEDELAGRIEDARDPELAVGGDRAAWYREALASMPLEYPAVKALLFFEVGNDRTVTYQGLDWTVRRDSAIVRSIRSAVKPWAPGVDRP